MAGFIYILEHSSGSTVKVGETKVSPEARAAGYARDYKLANFKLAKVFEVPEEERKNIERRAHKTLSKYKLSGISGAREIFSCSLSEAVAAVEEAINSVEGIKRWKEAEEQRKALKKAIGAAEKERDDALRELKEDARNWSNQRAVQRSKLKENLLDDYNRQKYLFLLAGFGFTFWAYTDEPWIGLLVGSGLLWLFFKWRGKIIDNADEEVDQKFPMLEFSEHPNFSARQRNINSVYETRIRKIKDPSSKTYSYAASSSNVVEKQVFTCPTCSAKSKIPLGKAGRVTCPHCRTKTQVDARGNVKG